MVCKHDNFFPGVWGREQAVRISSIAAELVISIDSIGFCVHRRIKLMWLMLMGFTCTTHFFCLWCVRSWSGCRNLICYSCTCLFVDLIGLSVPREITLLWQMLMNFLFVFYLYYWWYGTIVVLAWHVQTKPGFSDRNVCHLVTLSVHAYILSI